MTTLEQLKVDVRNGHEAHDHDAFYRALDRLVQRADTVEQWFGVLAGKVGAFMEPREVAFNKLVERLDFGAPRAFPLKCPDGVVYDSPGSVRYPKDHEYAKARALLHEFASESQALRDRIEAATGQYYVNLKTKGP